LLCGLFDGQFRYGFEDEGWLLVRQLFEECWAATLPEVVQIAQIGLANAVLGPRCSALGVARLSRLEPMCWPAGCLI
jgi:hypothetical protein